MGQYDDWLRNGRNYRAGEEPEFYEDTHDDSGRFISPDERRPALETGRRVSPDGGRRLQGGFADGRRNYESDRAGYGARYSDGSGYSENAAARNHYKPESIERRNTEDAQPRYSTRNGEKSAYAQPSALPDKNQYIAPRFYQNVVVYEPRTPEDVQILIDYLKRREPAIINLNDIDDTTIAQRILDFLSGAEYALGGSVHLIADNIFLLTPEGVEITVPYDI